MIPKKNWKTLRMVRGNQMIGSAMSGDCGARHRDDELS